MSPRALTCACALHANSKYLHVDVRTHIHKAVETVESLIYQLGLINSVTHPPPSAPLALRSPVSPRTLCLRARLALGSVDTSLAEVFSIMGALEAYYKGEEDVPDRRSNMDTRGSDVVPPENT